MQGIHLFTCTGSGKWTQVKSKSDSFQHLSNVAEIVSEEGRREAAANDANAGTDDATNERPKTRHNGSKNSSYFSASSISCESACCG